VVTEDPRAPLPRRLGDTPALSGSKDEVGPSTAAALGRVQLCPRCGHLMPDLKGGSGSICSVCGFKDTCCY